MPDKGLVCDLHALSDGLLNPHNLFFLRWRTLLSVDDLVEDVVIALDDGKHLENTYIIFSSDNGFHLGNSR